MRLTHVEHAIREFCYGLKRSLRSHLAPMVLMAVALFILGLFFVGTINLRELIHLAHSKVGLTVYLTKDGGAAERSALQNLLSRQSGVRSASYVSEAEALQRFQKELGGRAYLLEGVEGNPLPASFEVELYDDYKTAEKMAELAALVRREAGVESVVYGESWVGRLERWIYFLVALDLFLGTVLGLSTLLVVGNTMKLALEGRKDTVEVLRLVGATRLQIRLPFLLEGALLGILASVLALALLHETYEFALARLAGILFLGTGGVVLFFVLGGALGAGGSLLSIHKYLKVRRS